MKTDYEFCILKNEKDIIEYEKAVYITNSKKRYKKDNYLSIYNIIDNYRAKTKISYSNIKIFAIKKNGELLGGIAFNFENKKMQLELRGFSIKKENNICEAFGLCTLKTRDDEIGYVGAALMQYVDEQLKKTEIKKIYATATERMTRVHQQRGAKILDKKSIDGVDWYLVCYEV
jgi:N-acetylglutamate synthase-like GNAT family acetyltransferase